MQNDINIEIDSLRLNSHQLRLGSIDGDSREMLQKYKLPIYLMLSDVSDSYNVGTAFRLADAMGICELWLCGKTEVPPNHRIAKASVGTDKWVNWKYLESVSHGIGDLRIRHPNLCVCAIEQSEKSALYTSVEYDFPLALILGNESAGIHGDVLRICDHVLEIPMKGINRSLNLVVSGAIVISHVIAQYNQLQK